MTDHPAAGARPHILVLNRWDDEFARYHEYIDHSGNLVSYVTTASARPAIHADLACEVHVLPTLEDWAEVAALARQLAARHGPIDRVIALSEFDLDLGASLRETLGARGPTSLATRLVRDKVAMKRAVSAAGMRVPRFSTALDRAAVHDFARRTGLPLILKPRTGAASHGVHRADTPEQLETLLRSIDPGAYEVEEYVSGDIYHIDGLVAGGILQANRSARYLNTCLDFENGLPLGSVAVDDPHLTRELDRLTHRVLAALRLETGAYHLEVIRAEQPGPEWVFLEIGGRVGGGEIPFVWNDVYGIDLVGSWIRLLLGQPASLRMSPEVAGFAMIPEPREVPCEVVGATSLLGKLPTLYAEVLPSKGDRLDGHGGYDRISGRFRFRGPTSSAVERDVRLAMETYRLDYVPRAA